MAVRYTRRSVAKERANVKKAVNRLINPCLAAGHSEPRGWSWETSASRAASWSRTNKLPPSGPGGIRVELDATRGRALFHQSVTCKPGTYYRIDAVVSTAVEAEIDTVGAVLCVQPLLDGETIGPALITPGIRRTTVPVDIRTYYQAPSGVRRLRISCGLVDARGWVVIHEVRFIKIIEPEEESHPLAIPAPHATLGVPRLVRKVSVISAKAEERGLTQRLRLLFGERHVAALDPSTSLSTQLARSDAILMPDPMPPDSVPNLAALLRLADERIVVISVPAFAELSRGRLRVRTVEQDDDPIHARVVNANYATHGFALHDCFAFAWRGRQSGSFVQRHFRRTPELRNFLKRYGLEPLLESMCDREVTSNRPASLFRINPKGALFVLDVEPLEVEPSTMSEPLPGWHLIQTILGRCPTPFGQYTVPHRTAGDFHGMIRETAFRFAPFVVHDDDAPNDRVNRQLVTLGRRDKLIDLPQRNRSVILIRSGLSAGDVEGIYGVYHWFKNLVRMPPNACPYAGALHGRFELVWQPRLAAWEVRSGWRPRRIGAKLEQLPIDPAEISLLLDVVSHTAPDLKVLVSGDESGVVHFERWLPRLWESLGPPACLRWNVPPGSEPGDRSRLGWTAGRVELALDSRHRFDDSGLASVLSAAACHIRIQVPRTDWDYPARSLETTDLLATSLEHIIGLHYGLIAVNRGVASVQLDGLPPVAPGAALIMDRQDTWLSSVNARAS